MTQRADATTSTRQREAEVSVRDLLAADTATRSLGISLGAVDVGVVTASMPITPSMVNGLGVAHGGYLFLLADTAFAYACAARGTRAMSRHADITYLSPAREGHVVVAHARERSASGRSVIVDVRLTLSDGTLIAESRGHGTVV
ncbi:hotdog fold thioesterase [Microbacterium sp. SORGH_AS_0888]|uniref:hotdog fold thioesterase n=1 Tax=Microbacterium sp. SORGH_AS_0888 TaxID=3041791 RepID=UPI00278A47B4|nr:hotdog fold thioesterase [Microbacterium sp. SORGH_AS_0888]MDQ1131003.1 acyl-CoA thioesterase [Microbacterium sp. SORGH_AS_0888]